MPAGPEVVQEGVEEGQGRYSSHTEADDGQEGEEPSCQHGGLRWKQGGKGDGCEEEGSGLLGGDQVLELEEVEAPEEQAGDEPAEGAPGGHQLDDHGGVIPLL